MNKLSIFILSLFSITVYAYDFTLESGENQVQVIELFTSEGCSSCPPAERWLSGLKTHPQLWTDIVPIAFHVDYWDDLGWQDPYSATAFSLRQRVYYAHGNLKAVYTPAVLVYGQEWRAWRNQSLVQYDKAVGRLSVQLKGNRLQARFKTGPIKSEYNLNIALLGMNIRIPIKAGENAGKTLSHDFVVLKHLVLGSNKQSWNINLDEDFFQSEQNDLAFVAWIQDTLNPAPIQAVGISLE
ncbi:MAG TPA: DUF1223 domain-containing protein [Oceanospirillales bacterium]|nr:DUF1223 domain-containing protein [Oceanospirillales bacterium]